MNPANLHLTATWSGENMAKEGRSCNGDSFLYHTHENGDVVAAVFDGARSPYDFHISDTTTTDAFASQTLMTLLRDQVVNFYAGRPLPHAVRLVREVNARYGALWKNLLPAYERSFRKNGKIDPQDTLEAKVFNPAAAFALVVARHDGVLSLAQGTDCTISMVSHEGGTTVLTPCRHGEMEKAPGFRRAFNKPAHELLAEGASVKDLLARENETLRHNRGLFYNHAGRGGIAVMNGDPALESCGKMVTMAFCPNSAAKIHRLYLMSDGMTPDRSNGGVEDAVRHINKYGATSYHQSILVPHFGGRDPIPTDATVLALEMVPFAP